VDFMQRSLAHGFCNWPKANRYLALWRVVERIGTSTAGNRGLTGAKIEGLAEPVPFFITQPS
jgi:hypothetical protein